MSAETKARLDAAMAEHIADETDGEILTGYVLQTQATSVQLMDEEATRYLRLVAEGQGMTTTLGLIAYAKLHVDALASQDYEDLD